MTTYPFTTPAEWAAFLHFRSLVESDRKSLSAWLREAVGAPIDKAEDFVFRADGPTVVDRAAAGAFHQLNVAVSAALSEAPVLRRYRESGHEVTTLSDIRALELDAIASTLPPFSSNYQLAATVTGAVSGALGPVGAVTGLPTLVATSLHAVNHHALHFGHDVHDPVERQFVVLVLTTGLTSRPSLHGPLLDRLRRVACSLEVEDFDGEGSDRMILENVAEAIVLRLLLGRLTRSFPGVGIILGMNFSRAFVAQVCATARAAYEQRWLFRRHGASLLDLPS